MSKATLSDCLRQKGQPDRLRDAEIALTAGLRVTGKHWSRYTGLQGSNRPRMTPKGCLLSLRVLEDTIRRYHRLAQRKAKEQSQAESLSRSVS